MLKLASVKLGANRYTLHQLEDIDRETIYNLVELTSQHAKQNYNIDYVDDIDKATDYHIDNLHRGPALLLLDEDSKPNSWFISNSHRGVFIPNLVLFGSGWLVLARALMTIIGDNVGFLPTPELRKSLMRWCTRRSYINNASNSSYPMLYNTDNNSYITRRNYEWKWEYNDPT